MAVVARVLRKHMLGAMQLLGEKIQASEGAAIRSFRRVHTTALLINLAQLVMIVWGVLQLSKQYSQPPL